MPRPLSLRSALMLFALAASLVLAPNMRAEELFFDLFSSLTGIAPEAATPQAGCQGNCGWISDGCCAEDCCLTQTTARLEYLLWWGRGQNIPPLVTTSPAGTPQDEAGVLGFPDTTILFGGEAIHRNLRSGGRITINHMLDDCGNMLGARFWGVEDAKSNFFQNSDGDPILARPFFNTQIPGQDAQLIAFPGVVASGRVDVQTSNNVLGVDAWFRRCLSRDACFQMDWLVGYQFIQMNDSIFIRNSQADVTGIAVPIGTIISVSDAFRAHNQFHGATLGLVVDNQFGAWQLDLLAKVAIGNMHQTVIVSGQSFVTEPGLATVETQGGLLGQGTNSGTRSRNRFAYIPEINANLGYRVNDQWSLTLGYTFMYFSDVALAGSQIDTTVNLSQNPGPLVGAARPAPLFNHTDYWLQGLSLGADFRF